MPKITDRVYRVQAPYSGNAVHLYLVRGEKLALVDSGALDSPSVAVEPALRELGLGWGDLDVLINTHGHKDHAGGNSAVREFAPEARIGIHRDDAFLTGGPEAHLSSYTDTSSVLRTMGREDLLPEYEATLRTVVGPATAVDRVLEDGDTVDLGAGVTLRVIHTPGHTAGSVCFFWESERIVFTGDSIQGHGWRPGNPPIVHDTVYASSIDRVSDLGAQTMCMGHTFISSGVMNDPVRRGPEVEQTLQSSRDAGAVVAAAVALAVERHGIDAPFMTLAETAFRELVYDLPIPFDRRTTVPPAACIPIRANLVAQGWKAR